MVSAQLRFYYYLVISLVILHLFLFISSAGAAGKIVERCQTCRRIVTAFHDGVKKTTKSGFGGGNTAWEEKSLGKYLTSETRLIEITESLCKDSGKESLCHHMVEESEDRLENWWFQHFAKNKDTDLENFLCIEHFKVCCPQNTFGPKCDPCKGAPDKPCSGHGSCDGGGTRSGTGKCKCDSGYTSDLCNECKTGYYSSSEPTTGSTDGAEESEAISCLICDSACDKNCTGPGPGGCIECKTGWDMSEDNVCEDVDECEEGGTASCTDNQFCENTPGSYSCRGCDGACVKCSGAGNDKCLGDVCSPGYTLESEGKEEGGDHQHSKCIDVDECALQTFDCQSGQYCSNTHGSYSCIGCHGACTTCSGPGDSNCIECKEGYTMKEGGGPCIDVDECAAGKTCEPGFYCKNTPGSATCRKCDHACTACTDDGPDMCVGDCRKGYKKEEDECVDINECQRSSGRSPCAGENEKCVNFGGGYSCQCKDGYDRRKDKKCVKSKPKKSPKSPPSISPDDNLADQFEMDPKTGQPRLKANRHQQKPQKHGTIPTTYWDLAQLWAMIFSLSMVALIFGRKYEPVTYIMAISLVALCYHHATMLERRVKRT